MNVLIINTPCFSLGGVERYFYLFMMYFSKRNYRIIWVTTKSALKRTFFKDLVSNEKIEKVFCKDTSLKLFKNYPKINIKPDDNVTIFSFTPSFYFYAERFRYRFKKRNYNIKHFLVMMNFFGENTFPDDGIKSVFFKEKVSKFYKQLYQNLYLNKSLLAFSEKHLKYLENKYNILIENKKELVLKRFSNPKKPNLLDMSQRALMKSENFVITACSRFEFPHKGFLIGLIKQFPKIKEAIPSARLNIIGYGDDTKINETMNLLDYDTKKHIKLYGQTDPNELLNIYTKSVVSVSLAGAASTSASCGLPTIIARHNNYNCEVYGFYSSLSGETLMEESGYDLIPYLRNVYSMSKNDYIKLSQEEFNCYKNRHSVDKKFLIKKSELSSNKVFVNNKLFLKHYFYLFLLKFRHLLNK